MIQLAPDGKRRRNSGMPPRAKRASACPAAASLPADERGGEDGFFLISDMPGNRRLLLANAPDANPQNCPDPSIQAIQARTEGSDLPPPEAEPVDELRDLRFP